MNARLIVDERILAYPQATRCNVDKVIHTC